MLDLALFRSTLLDECKTDESFITSDMDLSTANKLWLSKAAFKKFKSDAGDAANEECLRLFRMSNNRCLHFSFSPNSNYERIVIEEVKTLFDNAFFAGPDSKLGLEEIFSGFNTGPGASIGSVADNFYTKVFDSDLTCTSSHLYDLYVRAISKDPRWAAAEQVRYLKHGLRIVKGNRLSYVPKTSEVRGVSVPSPI